MKVSPLCSLTRISLLGSGVKLCPASCTRLICLPLLLYPGRHHLKLSMVANPLFLTCESSAVGLMSMCRRTSVALSSPSPGSVSSLDILLIIRAGSAGILQLMRYSSPVMCALWRRRCLVLNLGSLALVMSRCLECSQAQWENLLALCRVHLCRLLSLPTLTLTMQIQTLALSRT